ncbi:MAG: hypothetical protein RLP44_18235 [Aggregatilineales bacterium]
MNWSKRFLLMMGMSLIVLFAGLSAPNAPVAAQDLTDLFSMSINAGFDGYFRSNQWLPVRVSVENNGDPINGRMVVRPETSGSGLPNSFSTPVDLPTGSSQVITLYITAYSNARNIRVEILDETDRVVASEETVLRSIATRDRLFVVLSQAAGGSVINLAAVNTGGNTSYQANWAINSLPERAVTLQSVDAMLFNDIDTGTLSLAQRSAIRDWVISGGHLIVAGGASWQSSAAGLEDLLPFVPEDSETETDLDALLRFGGDYATTFDEQFIIATGEPIDGAQVLVSNADGLPLLVRRALGNGTVDYLTVDPNAQPLRDWQNLSEFWLTELASVDAKPSWTNGFSDWQSANNAVEILPGLELLPSILLLLAFLVGYVALVGPLNYLVLQRINRLDWAWITIPIFIVVFSVVARGIGISLRGNQITLSRVSVVQTWTDTDVSQVDQLIGLLAPRRDNYSLGVDDDRLLRPIPDNAFDFGVLSDRSLSNVNIVQNETFEAVDFPLDAGFIAGFNTMGTIPRPEISGSLTLSYDEGRTFAAVQGSVRNNSDLTLTDAVILTRAGVLRLADPLAPGDVQTFNANGLTLNTSGGVRTPAPSALELSSGEFSTLSLSQAYFRSSSQSYAQLADITSRDILGADNYDISGIQIDLSADAQTQENRRRQALLNAFISDQYASTSRGDHAYLVGWTDTAPLDEVIGGAGWEPLDTTLYIIELDVIAETPATGSTVIARDQFTWVSLDRTGTDEMGPYSLNLFNATAVTFRFTPLPDAVLSEVDTLNVILERPNVVSSVMQVEIWDWEAQTWDDLQFNREESLTVRNPERYLGALNAVQIRIQRPETGGSVFIEQVAVEQIGSF